MPFSLRDGDDSPPASLPEQNGPPSPVTGEVPGHPGHYQSEASADDADYIQSDGDSEEAGELLLEQPTPTRTPERRRVTLGSGVHIKTLHQNIRESQQRTTKTACLM